MVAVIITADIAKKIVVMVHIHVYIYAMINYAVQPFTYHDHYLFNHWTPLTGYKTCMHNAACKIKGMFAFLGMYKQHVR